MSKETKIPAIPNSSEPSIKALKEATEVRLGRRGDPLDRGITVRDLYEGGVIKVRGFPIIPLATDTSISVNPIVGDTSAPPAPSGLTASGAFVGILLQWDEPSRSDLTTYIWRNTVDILTSAVLIGTAQGEIFSDSVGHGSTYYYWIQYSSDADTLGPFNSTAGTIGVTSLKISDMMADLSDELNQSHLSTVLSNEIDKIDGIDTTILQHTSAISGLSGEHYVKIDLGANAVSGYGLAANAGGSEFAVLANVFKISTAAGSKIVPFFVDSTGTWIDTAMIKSASIDSAMIGSLNVDEVNITGTLGAAQIGAGTISSVKIDGNGISAEKITMDGNIQFGGPNSNNWTGSSGVQFGKTSLGSTSVGAFFGRSGGVSGLNISSATSGIYADSAGTVALNNVRLYTGAAGSAAVYPNPGTFTLNISSISTSIQVEIIGGGGGACNNSNSGTGSSPYGARAGTAGTASWIKWYSGLNGTGSVLTTYDQSGNVVSTNGAGGSGTPAASVGSNNSSASGAAGQASSKAAGGLGGHYGYNYTSTQPTSGTFGSGGGGASAITTNSGTFDAPVNVSAGAGGTVSQLINKPTGAQSISIQVGTGGTGGQGFSEFIGGNGNVQGRNITAGGNGGNGYVQVADPNSGGIEVDLLSIVNRLTAAGI